MTCQKYTLVYYIKKSLFIYLYDSVPKNWNVLIFIRYTESDTNSVMP